MEMTRSQRSVTLPRQVARHARQRPDAVALVHGDVRRSCGDLDARL